MSFAIAEEYVHPVPKPETPQYLLHWKYKSIYMSYGENCLGMVELDALGLVAMCFVLRMLS